MCDQVAKYTPRGILGVVKLTEDRAQSITARLRRAEGQLRGIQTMIEEDRDCQDIIAQFAAATRAIERAGYTYFSATLAECALHPDEATAAGYTPERLEQLFMQLA